MMSALMASTAVTTLRAFSSWLLIASLVACIGGLAWTVAEAPCSRIGAYLLLFAVALAAQAAIAHLVRAFLEHPIRCVIAFLLVALVCGIEYFVSYTFTPLLCRG